MEAPDSTQSSLERTSQSASPLTEKDDTFFPQDFLGANLLDVDVWKDLDLTLLDLGYFDELFKSSSNEQLSLMNPPALTFESPGTDSFEQLSVLDKLNIDSLLVKEPPSAAITAPPLKFVQESVRELYRNERSVSTTLLMLPTAPLDGASDLETLKVHLQWNRALQARIRADLQAVDNGLRMQAEYIRMAARNHGCL